MITTLCEIHRTYSVFHSGDFNIITRQDRQLIFRRRSQRGQLTFALNADKSPAVIHADFEERAERFAQENGLGNTLDGAHFVKETYHGLPCTKFFHSETGTIIYFENILLYWNTGDGEIRTTSLEGVDGWIYQ